MIFEEIFSPGEFRKVFSPGDIHGGAFFIVVVAMVTRKTGKF